MKTKNIMLYAIIAVLLVFTIIYFTAVNHISYAFTDDSKALYDNKVQLITDCAEIYAKKNISLFEDKDTIYVTVSELVEKGALEADDEHGNVKDPTSEVKLFNDAKVRITKEKDNFTAKLLLD
jgi:hypothetical protein